MESTDFLFIPFKGLGPAFLLDIQLRYSYILPNQKRVLIVIITRHDFWREVILACSTAL